MSRRVPTRPNQRPIDNYTPCHCMIPVKCPCTPHIDLERQALYDHCNRKFIKPINRKGVIPVSPIPIPEEIVRIEAEREAIAARAAAEEERAIAEEEILSEEEELELSGFEKKKKFCCDSCREKHEKKKREKMIDLRFQRTNVASNLVGAGIQNPNIVNSWGIIEILGKIWIVNNGTGTVVPYDPLTNTLGSPITVQDDESPGAPTGIVHNTTNGFVIMNGPVSAPALWLVATENGTVSGFNPSVYPTSTSVIIDRSGVGAVYKGLTIIGSLLYVADFHNNRIDVFDGNRNLLPISITDPTLPHGFAPFNVANIHGLLYVAYALQKPPDNHDDQAGPGNGFINIFDPHGTLLRRLVSHGALNSPWALLEAPRFLHLPPRSLLVGNFGDGRINVYNDTSGAFIGTLQDCNRAPLVIDGLWGLSLDTKAIYFASGPNDEENGIVGRIAKTCPFIPHPHPHPFDPCHPILRPSRKTPICGKRGKPHIFSREFLEELEDEVRILPVVARLGAPDSSPELGADPNVLGGPAPAPAAPARHPC